MSQLFQQLENQGYIIDDLVKDTLEQQLSNNLLPIKIEKITEQYLILSYQNTIEAETILSAFPILKSLYESLNLTQDIVSIENPSLIIENYQNNEAIFQLQIPNLQTSAISSLLTQIGLLGIPDSNNINLNLAENSLSLTYLGDVSFSNLLQSIPTVETIANELNLPNNITISNPSITINQSTSQTPNYDISVSQLPITELTDWLEAQLIPTELLTTVNNIDLQLSDKDIKVTYLGEVNLSSVINTMTRELGYNNTIEQTLTVLNPSLLIQEKADNTKFYELTLSQIPTNEITGLLANLTEVNLFNELGTLGEVDLVVSSNGIEVSYDDTINLDIGTVISLNENLSFLQSTLESIVTALGGTGTTLALAESHISLLKEGTETDVNLTGLFNGEEIQFTQKGNTLLLGYDGTINAGAIISHLGNQIPNVTVDSDLLLGIKDFEIYLDKDNTTGKVTDYKLSIGEILADNIDGDVDLDFIGLLGKFGFSLPDWLVLPNINLSELNLDIGLDSFGFTLGNIDISSLLNGLGLGFNVDNFTINAPKINLDFAGELPSYEFNIPSLPNLQLQNLFSGLEIPSFFGTLIGELGNLDITIGNDWLKIISLDSINLSPIINDLGLGELFNFDLNLTPTLNLESINGIPQYTFTLPALPKTDLQSLFNSFKLPDFAVSFLADLANFNVTIGTDLLTFEGIGDINLTPLINGLGFGELLTTDFSIGLPTFEIKTIEGIDYFNVSLPSVNKPELQNLLNGLNLPEFASNLLSNLSNLQFTIGEDWFQFTALEPINLSPIINNFGFGDLLDFDLNLVPTINVELIDGVKQFSLSLPPLSQADLQGLLDSLGLPDLAVNFLAELGQIELTIGDNFLKLNGLEGVDFAPIINELGVVNLPEFTVGIPSFEMFKVDGINEFKFTIPQIDEIQVNNLLDGLDGLPSFAKDFFNVLDKIKVELGEDWTRITYLDEVGITSIVNNLSEELGFTTDINADISVFLPSLYIQEINGEKFYEVTLPQISTGEVMGLLGEMTDVNLFNELTTLGKVDLVLSEDSFRVKYFDDVKLDLGKVVEIDSSLTFLQEGISGIVAMFGGTETSLTLDTPDLILTKTTLGTEINLDTLFNGSDFDLQIQGDKVNLNYEGSIDVFALVNSVMSQLTNVDISEILKLMGTGINVDINVINGVKKLAFDVDSLETVSLPNLFNLFDLSLPDFAIDFLGELPSVNFNLDGDLLNFTGLGEIDLSGILNGLEFGLNLGSLNVNLPSLQLDLSGSLPNYQLTIPPLPKATFDTLFGSLGLPKFATDFLGELGNVSFNIGTDFFQIKGLGDVDLRNILNGFGLNLDTNLDFSVSFPTLDIQLIDGVKNFALTIPELPNITLSNLLDSFPEMPNFMVDFLVGLGDIDLTIGNDFINFDFLGEVDIRGMLNGLSVDLGLGELDATFGAFNVENPTINLKGLGTPNLSYHVNIPSVDFDGIINLLTDLGGVSLPDSIKLKLASLGDIGLTISDLGLALDFENDFSLNLGNLFSLDGAVPYMDTALDSLISGIFGTPDLTLSTPNLSLLKDVNLGGMNLELDGLLNGQNFGFTFGNSITFNYDLPNDLDFTTLLPNIPILGDVKLLYPQIFLTDLSHSITLPELGKIDLVSGLNLAGTIDFAGLDTNFGNFINGLGIDNLDVNLGFNPAGLTSLWGNIDGDFDLFTIDSLKVGFSDLNLGLDIGVDLEPSFGLSGNFSFEGYDPTQVGEPTLNLSGGINFEPESLSLWAYAEGDSTWYNPYGLVGTELRNIGIQGGGTYLAPYIDNIGFIGNLKWGEAADLSTAFSIDTNDPEKVALVLTTNEAVNLVDLWKGPLVSFVLNQLNTVENPVIDGFNKTLELLGKVVDLQIESVDGNDADTELDPLVKYVPFPTKVAGQTISEGFEINGKLTAWGADATLILQSNTTFTNLEGTLNIPEFDLKIPGTEQSLLKVEGIGDNSLDITVAITASQQLLSGDGKIGLLGYDIASAEFEITPTKATIKDFDLNLVDIVSLNVDSVTVDLATQAASGKADITVLGQTLADSSFTLIKDAVTISDTSLNVANILGIEVDSLTVNVTNQM